MLELRHDSSSLFCLWKIPGTKQLVKLNSKQYSEYSSLWKSKMAHKWDLAFPRCGGLCHWTALLQFYVSLLAAVVKVRCPFFSFGGQWPPVTSQGLLAAWKLVLPQKDVVISLLGWKLLDPPRHCCTHNSVMTHLWNGPSRRELTERL